MRKKTSEKTDSVSKIVIYKLENKFSLDEALGRYKELKGGSLKGWTFRIFIKAMPNRVPAWYPLIQDVVDKNNIPRNSYTSLVILFGKEQRLFALTAGYGYADVRGYAVQDFGVDIACKSLNPNELDELYQKVPTGNVYGLRRSLRGRYIPANDQINKRSVLKALRGKIIDQTLGIRMEGRTSLAISGNKDLASIVNLLDELVKIEGSDKITVPIRGLDEVSKDLRLELEQELLTRINGDNFDDILFGYDDDLVFNNCEKLKVGRDSTFYSIDDINNVLEAARNLNKEDPAHVRVTGYNDQDVEIFKKQLIDLIEGELDYKGNKYFRIDRKWYRTNDEYRKRIESDFKTLETLKNDYFTIWPSEKGRFLTEDDFLNKNVNKNRILAHTKKISHIEFADLIDKVNNYVIHVKKGRGAYLRNLFAQGYVPASLFNSDELFKKEAIKKFELDTTRKFTVIYAIFPEGKTDIDSIFTLFAKVDMLERCGSLKSMGFDVRYCLIRH